MAFVIEPPITLRAVIPASDSDRRRAPQRTTGPPSGYRSRGVVEGCASYSPSDPQDLSGHGALAAGKSLRDDD